MDLWDVAKVMWRRKLIALPLLAVTAAIAVFLNATFTPDYKAVGHVTLLPPSESKPEVPSAKPQTTPSVVSPWNVYSLADAIVIYFNRADVREQFQQEGFSSEWTVSIGGTQLPVLELEVVATDPEKARQTLARLISALKDHLSNLQRAYGVEGAQGITGETLDSGQNVEAITSALKRMLIVVIAIGVIITMAVCLWVDALFRRRRNRIEVTGTLEIDPSRTLPAGYTPAMPYRTNPPTAPPAPGTAMRPAPQPARPRPSGTGVPVDTKVIIIDHRPGGAEPPTMANDLNGSNGSRQPDTQETVVLPLAAMLRNRSEDGN